MTSKQTLERLDEQIYDDSQRMLRLTDEAATGMKVSRQIDKLQGAIDIKVALSGGLRRGDR